MWVPGLRNLHMARETWLIKMDPAQALDKLVDGVEDYDKAELMEVHKVPYDTNGSICVHCIQGVSGICLF